MGSIVTIGSCLSENVGVALSTRTGSEVRCVVRHNRSDQVLRAMMKREIPTLEELLAQLSGIDGLDLAELGNDVFVLGQSAEGIGKSTWLHAENFVGMLGHPDVDLVLIDNFMDVKVFLWGLHDGEKVFARLPLDCGLSKGPQLAPETSAENFEAIAAKAHEIWPAATVIFLHYPYAHYPPEAGRPRWGRRFFKAFSIPQGASAYGPIFVNSDDLLRTQAHDFLPHVYGRIASDLITKGFVREG